MRVLSAHCLAALLVASAAQGAEIQRFDNASDDVTFITLRGEIGFEDVGEFRKAMEGVERGMVVLDSPGGRTAPSLDIGRMVRERSLTTAVPAGVRCMSGCALIWIAGSRRLAHVQSEIGFHGAYGQWGLPSRTGNALVGAYLYELGFLSDFIKDATRAGASEFVSVTKAWAEQHDLQVEWVLPDHHAPDPPWLKLPRRPIIPQPEVMESEAEDFVWRLMLHREHDGALPELFVDAHFARRVDYFGETIGRAELKRRHRSQADRWPVHRIRMIGRPRASCSDIGICTVSGRAMFHAESAARNRRSDGTIRYTYRLERQNDGFVVIGEGLEALERHHRPIRSGEVRLVRRLQGELLRLGCNPGPLDGIWGPRTAAALARFERASGAGVHARPPTQSDLTRVKSLEGPVCNR